MARLLETWPGVPGPPRARFPPLALKANHGKKPRLDRIGRLARGLALLWLMLLVPGAAQADPADIDAAARGVVRVVIVEISGDEVIPISHGTGFAVGPERVVTNAHVVAEARE